MLDRLFSTLTFFYVFLFFIHNCISEKSDIRDNLLKNEQTKDRFKRAIKNMDDVKLSLPINYYINPGTNSRVIKRVLQYIKKETCITFKEKRDIFVSEGFLFILDTESRVSVGPTVKNMSQPIMFNSKCSRTFGCILNLVGHALGLIYTHNRPDRGDYININRKNFEFFEYEIFHKNPQTNVLTYNTSYGYGSLMHEGRKFMTIGSKVISSSKTLHPYNYMIGQRYYLSFNDVKLLNYYYCDKKCSSKKKLNCYNNGYANPNDCKKCKCPNGYTKSKVCKKVYSNSKKCGRSGLYATKKLHYVKAAKKISCTYHITSKVGTKIKIYVKHSNTKEKNPCFEKMGLEIKYRKDKGAVGLCLCGNYTKFDFVSENRYVMINYNGKSNSNSFKIAFKQVEN
ncbi:Astacin-like metalloendopeptidase [Strongyloides ratti]|uniref:Metalloendopeptidase n=1 Tax=Strongyloides ratti TaxID=34506 RepID=A0A090LQD3_STRRB|nr:Astacin-like metalloendopeptidase [Strongyloides ratti]CEF69761.1 Astacin-like metalloendopeptidase [Strongyloides ratti]